MSTRCRFLLYLQVQALLLAGLAVPASAQTIAWSDLEGRTVLAEITREQVVQRQHQVKLRVHDDIRLSIGPADIIRFSNSSTVHSPGGANKLDPVDTAFTLNETRRVARDGGGDAVWQFSDGTLTFIRTFQAGARRMTFAFARGSDGLTCSAGFAFAREDGKGPVRMTTPQGQQQTIVSAKQLSSKCKVMDRK